MQEIDFEKVGGLVPTIAQDAETGEVLMLAYMNRESFEKTLKTGLATYWSRSRQELWTKGKSSGNVQKVKDILLDCDGDTIVLKVEQVGGSACHTGYRSCFFRRRVGDKWVTQGEKVFDPKEVYGDK
jgi:phosphoribosyl-AMP cyclohydrolase